MSASAVFNVNSIVSGWQLLPFSSTALTGISGLSYDSTNRQLIFGQGVYIITASVGSPLAYLFGMQSSTTATTPSSLLTPELDVYAYADVANVRRFHTITFVYVFTTTTPVRFYLNSSGTATLYGGSVRITRLP
jgi:hypothetical protein